VARPRVLLLAALTAICTAASAASSPALGARAHSHSSWHCAKAGSCKRSAHHKRSPRRGGATGHGRRCPHATLVPDRWNLELIRSATLCLVNRERAAHGERPLDQNRRLQRAAQGHTESMALRGYFNHIGPLGGTPLSRIRAAGYIYGSHVSYAVGENIAWGTRSLATPRAIVAAWMASPGHRANILDGRFRDTAIGVCSQLPYSLGHGQPGAIYTQDFGARAID